MIPVILGADRFQHRVGSAPPTAQAYARALAQWRRLPGSIGTTATDLGNAAGTAKPGPEGTTKKDKP